MLGLVLADRLPRVASTEIAPLKPGIVERQCRAQIHQATDGSLRSATPTGSYRRQRQPSVRAARPQTERAALVGTEGFTAVQRGADIGQTTNVDARTLDGEVHRVVGRGHRDIVAPTMRCSTSDTERSGSLPISSATTESTISSGVLLDLLCGREGGTPPRHHHRLQLLRFLSAAGAAAPVCACANATPAVKATCVAARDSSDCFEMSPHGDPLV